MPSVGQPRLALDMEEMGYELRHAGWGSRIREQLSAGSQQEGTSALPEDIYFVSNLTQLGNERPTRTSE